MENFPKSCKIEKKRSYGMEKNTKGGGPRFLYRVDAIAAFIAAGFFQRHLGAGNTIRQLIN